MRATFLTLLLLLAATPALAQDAKQQLNDQMYEAVRRGDAAAVRALLDKGADVNAKFRYGATALFKAAERGNADIVKLLLARGADATVRDTFYSAKAMTWALGDNINVELVGALLEKDPTSVEDVLMAGVNNGNVALVEVALARGGAKPETLTAALAASMSDKDKAAIAEALKKAGAKQPLEVDAATLQSYVGRYKPEQGGEITFALKDGKLFAIRVNNPNPLALMAIDKTTFRPVAFEGLVITFTVEGDKAASVSLKQGANTTVFKRVEESKQ
jgi:hypothetical protein